MTDSAFDDQSFLGNLPENENSGAEERVPSSGPKKPSSPPFKRFDDEDLLGEIPDDDDPLYPEMMTSQPDAAPPARPLPWFLDIFLYPVNRTGIINLAITFGVPLILILLTVGCIAIAKAAPLLILLAVPLALGTLIVTILMGLYFAWYVTECVRSSSEGQIRAPDTIGQTPGMMELFALCFQVLLCSMVFLGTSASVQAALSPPNWAQQTLNTVLALLLPMTLLSVISLESIRGLNPLLNLRLIALTFLPYCGVAIPLYLAHKVLFRVCLDMPNSAGIITLTLCEVYGAMVSAHVLGRFAWKQQDKLIWE